MVTNEFTQTTMLLQIFLLQAAFQRTLHQRNRQESSRFGQLLEVCEVLCAEAHTAGPER